MRSIPKAVNLPTLNGEVMATFGVMEAAAQELGSPSFMHDVTVSEVKCV